MKNLIILLFALLTINGVKAQGCLPQGITFTTQEQIDNFQVNYPGCTEIKGDVIISDYFPENITNLNGLGVLNSIRGDLKIIVNPVLTSLAGLEGLTSIDSTLTISNNIGLLTLTGLEGLTSIGGDLTLIDNDALTNLSGLAGLTSIGRNIYLSDNNSLTSLTGLEGLTSINSNLNISNHISLITLTGLEGLTSIGGKLNITSNDFLISLTGLEGLSFIADLYLHDNSDLTSLTGLEGLTSIGGHFSIVSNDALTSLSGLEGLTSIGDGLGIVNNKSLTSITGLGALTSIGGGLWISSNDGMTSLSGMDSIKANSITDLTIYFNSNLKECEIYSICQYLTAPNGNINIHDNAPGCNSQEDISQSCNAGFGENIFATNFEISPNPANEKITISSSSISSNSWLSIFNVNAVKVMEMHLTDSETQINISALPRGVYFVRLQNEKIVGVMKMAKE